MSLIKRRDDVDVFDNLLSRRFPDWPRAWADWFEDTLPRVEEFEDGDTMVVRAEMPGLDPARDIEITLTDGTLRIRAERRNESRTDDAKGYRTEFRYGSFARTVNLPAGATQDDVKASYRDGILEVRIPLDTERAEARKVPIARD
jgi:HSP20 family protein